MYHRSEVREIIAVSGNGNIGAKAAQLLDRYLNQRAAAKREQGLVLAHARTPATGEYEAMYRQ